jgi:hypothetical protein
MFEILNNHFNSAFYFKPIGGEVNAKCIEIVGEKRNKNNLRSVDEISEWSHWLIQE